MKTKLSEIINGAIVIGAVFGAIAAGLLVVSLSGCAGGDCSPSRPSTVIGRRCRLKVNGAEGVIAAEPDAHVKMNSRNYEFYGVRYLNKAGDVKEIWCRGPEIELID